jgi:protein-tyrosine phosphatase
VPTGWLVGCLCVFAFPPPDANGSIATSRDAQAGRLARRYGIGAGVLALLSLVSFHLSVVLFLLLAWTALALACVALVYRSSWPGRFGKRTDGSLPMASWWLLAPYLFGAFLNSRWWTRHQPAPCQLADGVWIGRFPTSTQLQRTNAAAVLDMTAELPRLLPAMPYRCIPVLDLTVPTQAELRLAVETIGFWRTSGKVVLICCALGYSRSALVAAAWLSDQSPDLGDPAQVLAKLSAVRPGVVLGPSSVAALATYMQEARSARSQAASVHLQEAGHAG